MRITPLGDSALVVELGRRADEPTHHRVQAALRLLEAPPIAGVTELVPAFTTVTLFYDPWVLSKSSEPAESFLSRLMRAVQSRLHGLPSKLEPVPGRIVDIPVCYGGSFGPDLELVALRTGLQPDEVVRRHGSVLYLVCLIGFSPGFPYLSGLPESLELPRRATPRAVVPPGSVGIANQQSCIYPMSTPGGWNLIGRTPLQLFRVEAEPPSLLHPGDRVKFCSITPDEFTQHGPGA